MTTLTTETVRITIDAPFDQVVSDLSDPVTHPEWGTEFFSGPAAPSGDGEVLATVPLMGGEVHMKVDADPAAGRIDLYLAPRQAPFGPPLPIRVVPNADGVDVLFTLARFPGQSDDEWEGGLVSMARELTKLKSRHER
ncbi:MAG: hypothetical protein BMS9Abin07_0311 [Acidimicrobiia bacterium]|nr:MAG: hypothetical protein BMS9Abin07_0311 [Acidimicrobiia bacterium]